MPGIGLARRKRVGWGSESQVSEAPAFALHRASYLAKAGALAYAFFCGLATNLFADYAGSRGSATFDVFS
jgi:hypothetical protein